MHVPNEKKMLAPVHCKQSSGRASDCVSAWEYTLALGRMLGQRHRVKADRLGGPRVGAAPLRNVELDALLEMGRIKWIRPATARWRSPH